MGSSLITRPGGRAGPARGRRCYRHGVRPDELRVALRGLDLIDVGPDRARVLIGGVEVTVTIEGEHVRAEAASSEATPLHVQATLDPLGALAVHTSDGDFAGALLDGSARSRLERVLFGGARARLALGRWTIERRDRRVPPHELALAVAYVADRPRALAERWAALARRLGVAWRGSWNTRGGARFALPGPGGRRLAVDLIAIAPDAPADAPARLRTAVWWPDTAGSWRGQPTPLRLGGRDGARLDAPDLHAAWLWGLCDDAELVAQLAATVGASAPAAPATALTPAAPIAPMSVSDWPRTRAELHEERPAAAPPAWIPRPMPGSDAVIGLAETVDIDGVAVHTTVVAALTADAPARVRVRARTRGVAPMVRDRPGYHFLLAGLRRDDHLGDARIDDRYIVHADDLPWVRWWLGELERQALLATFDPEAIAPFALAIQDGDVCFEAGGLPPRRYLDAARQAAAFLATRADRAAGEWHALAPVLGASVRGDVWTTAGGFAVAAERGAAPVTIDLATELPFDRGGPRLRTCVRAPRRAEHQRLLALERDGLPRRHRVRRAGLGARAHDVRGPADLVGLTDEPRWADARLAVAATPLARARPDALVILAAEVVLTWEGPVTEPARLLAAIDAVATLAVEAAAPGAGPYR